jgi:exosortase A-associated hydrolase 2
MVGLKPRREAFFLPGSAAGERFCLLTHAADPVGTLIFVHPFAEEMNKSRRMVALAAEAFAARGWSTLQIDLTGCGDSAGDFGDASWDLWVNDCRDAWLWVNTHLGGAVALWGLRSGALVLADWLRSGGVAAPLLLWQPVGNGRQHLTQFLRLKAAGEMLADADAKSAMESVRASLKAGISVDVAGYCLSPALARGMESSTLGLHNAYAAPVVALELGPPGREEVSPALRVLIDRWVGAGIRCRAQSVAGPAFWQTQEIELCPALIDASLLALEEFA